MNILGLLNWASHDPAAAIVNDEGAGSDLIFATATEEQLLRCKNSYQFPLHALVDCMDRLGIESLREIDYLITDYSKVPRWINSGPHYRKLLHDYIKLNIDFPADRIVILRHHDAHAANAYYPSGYKDAAILVVDGVGTENETMSLYRGSGTRVEFLERSAYYGPGALYDVVTVLLGFVGNHNCAQPGKTMGLAPYGATAPGPVLNFAQRYEGLRIGRRISQNRPVERALCGTDIIGILADGTVTCCCLDYQGFTGLGNIFNEDLMSILSRNGAILEGLHTTGRLHFDGCKKCMGSPTKVGAAIKNAVNRVRYA